MKVSASPLSEDKKWQAEDDMRTLLRAKEIEKDPKRLAAARAMAKEKMAAMQQITKK